MEPVAAASAWTPAMILGLVGIISGALVAILGPLLSTRFQARQERARWLREHRRDVVVDLLLEIYRDQFRLRAEVNDRPSPVVGTVDIDQAMRTWVSFVLFHDDGGLCSAATAALSATAAAQQAVDAWRSGEGTHEDARAAVDLISRAFVELSSAGQMVLGVKSRGVRDLIKLTRDAA